MRNRKRIKKGAMRAWPSIIGGLIVVVIVIFIIAFIVSAGAKEIREMENKQAFSNFAKTINTAWVEYESTTTYWRLTGVPSEAWGIVFLDNDTVHSLRRMAACSPDQKYGPCINLDAKSVLSKCDIDTDDVCMCLVSLKTYWTPCGSFHQDPEDVRNLIWVQPGVNADAAYNNVKAWNKNKFMAFPNDELVDVVECEFIASELRCVENYGRPCLIKYGPGRVVTWIGTDDSDRMNIEALTLEKSAISTAWYLDIDFGTPGPWHYENETVWIWCPR